MSILVQGGLLVTQDGSRSIRRGDLLLEDGKISQVGEVGESAETVVDAEGCLVLPGLINGYTNAAHILLGPPQAAAPEDLRKRMATLSDQITRRDAELGAALAAAEMVLGGTTTFMDLSPWAEEVARAVTQVGCRGFLAQEVHSPEGLGRCARFLRHVVGWERVMGMVGVREARAPLLEECRDLALESGSKWCVVLSETRQGVSAFQKSTGKRPVEWLEGAGLLSPELLLVHCVWITLNEVRSLARSGSSVVHCPLSNQMTGQGGVAPLPEMLREGVPAALGTDSPFIVGSLDLLPHLRFCGALHRGSRWDSRLLPAQQLMDMCTTSPSKILGLEGGSLEPGRVADVVVLDPGVAFQPDPEEVLSHLVHGAGGMRVRDVIVRGRPVVQDGILKSLDVEDLRERVATLRGELFHETPGD